jgi:hypothetical protein
MKISVFQLASSKASFAIGEKHCYEILKYFSLFRLNDVKLEINDCLEELRYELYD